MVFFFWDCLICRLVHSCELLGSLYSSHLNTLSNSRGKKKHKAQRRRMASLQLQTEGARRRERESRSAAACVQGVTLVNNLPPILQLGCTFPKLQTMETAGLRAARLSDSPLLRMMEMWKQRAVSGRLNLDPLGSDVLPLIIHAAYARIRSTLERPGNTRPPSA